MIDNDEQMKAVSVNGIRVLLFKDSNCPLMASLDGRYSLEFLRALVATMEEEVGNEYDAEKSLNESLRKTEALVAEWKANKKWPFNQ